MDGMGFLLNSMGIDPDQIKDAAGKVQATAAAFEAKLNSIEFKMDLILSHIKLEQERQARESAYLKVNGVMPHAGSDIEH